MPEREYALGYVTMRFPLLSETFVIQELRMVREQGIPACVFSLAAPTDPLCHPEASRLLPHCFRLPFAFSWSLWGAVARMLRRRPLLVLGLLGRVVAGTWRRPGVLLRTLALFPKSLLLAECVQRYRIRHLHAHFANYPTTAAWIASELTGAGFSFTAHAHDIFVDQSLLAQKLRRATAAFPISDYNRRLLEEVGGAECCPLHVVHMGADLARCQPRPTAVGNGRPLRILSVARLDPMKGLHHLIQACHLLDQQAMGVECIIAGAGAERTRLERLVGSLSLQGKVHLVGWADSRRVAELLAWADVFALPCVRTASGKQDGIPVALMEAMACGLPVVSTTISGIPELVRPGCGLLVAPGDVVALAQALEGLSDARVRARLAGAGRRLVAREFDARANAVVMAGHLARLAGLGTPPGCPAPAVTRHGEADRVLALMYHRVLPQGGAPATWPAEVDPIYTVSEHVFASHLDYLQEAGYRTVSPEQLWRWRMGWEALPAGALLLTFDDGDPSHLEVVAPMLEARGMRGAFFVVAGQVGRPAGPAWDDLRYLRKQGHALGSHTLSHRPLAALSPAEARWELAKSRAVLEQGLGESVLFASAPHGSYSRQVTRMARRVGYLGLFTSGFGDNRARTSPFTWRRMAIRGDCSCQDLAGLCSGAWLPWHSTRLRTAARSAVRRTLGERTYRGVRVHLLRAREWRHD